MRKLIFAINTTLDGCTDHTKGIADEEIHEFFADLLRECDVIVYGRKTYELMVPFWPDMAKNHSGDTQAMNSFAEAFDSVKSIVVFSRSLDHVDHEKTMLIKTGLREQIEKLKQQEGRPISLGGVDLPSQLMQMDLIDEYIFVVHPLIAGEGRRLLQGINLPESIQLKLVESKVFDSGCVSLRYVRHVTE